MITIVTDSSSYFDKAEAQALGIKIVPLCYTVDGQIYSESYRDQNGDFETLLRSNRCFTTSQANFASYLSCFEEEITSGNQVLCITISSRLSGTYSTAYMAAKQAGNDSIAVFDSRLTAGGLYLLIKEAKKLIESGAGLNGILRKLPEIRDSIVIAFSVDDMEPLRRSGRIGFVRKSIGTILNIKPILLLNEGAVVSDGVAHGDVEIIKTLTRKVPADVKEVVVNYIGNKHLATNLYNVLHSAYPAIPISLHKIGPVLGIHLGVNVAAVSFIV